MFDRYEAGEQAVLVHIEFPNEGDREDLQELEMLVSSAGVNAVVNHRMPNTSSEAVKLRKLLRLSKSMMQM